MSRRIIQNEPFIHLLARSRPKRRKSLLKQATREELTSLFEICLNILKGNMPLNQTEYQRLKKHRNIIRKLANKRLSFKRKKVIVNQKGGFLGTLASIAIPVLGSLLAGARR